MLFILFLLILQKITEGYPKIGVSTSAYQIEGAYQSGCKGLSIWDTFSSHSSNIRDHSNGTIACDHYHHMEEDIKIIHELNITSYRFSLSWTRLLPNGRDYVCDDGIRFYSRLLDELEKYNITPFVTIFHWDLPQALEDEYGGWLDPKIIDDFTYYADFIFHTFGHRVKNWMTLNEPYTYCVNAYVNGIFAPGIVEPTQSPYICGHHMILAHASAYRLYNTRFRSIQQGSIGIALNCDWAFPVKPSDIDAVQRTIEFRLGWFSDPLLKGQYPQSMRMRLGERSPGFTPEQTQMVNNSIDFFALNHYTSFMVSNSPNQKYDFMHDAEIDYHNVPYRARADSTWLYEVPDGIYHMIRWLGDRYRDFFNGSNLIISENGVSMHNNFNVTDDAFRIRFLSGYLEKAILGAEDANIGLSHFFIWSLLDNFEWSSGYTERFGIVYIDFNSPLKTRILKNSAYWVKNITSKYH